MVIQTDARHTQPWTATMTGPRRRAALYLRVSTEDQARDGFSLPAQEARLRDYCRAQSWEVSGIYADDGYSGKSLDRPQITALLADVEKGRADVVAVWRLDRLSRRQLDVLHVIENILTPQGVAFVSATESFDTSTPAGMAMVGMLSAFAQLERSTIVARTRFGFRQRLLEGQWNGKAPFGFRYGPSGALEPDPKEAPWIPRIFARCIDGWSMRRIAEFLKTEGAPVPQTNWHVRTVEWILHNRAYLGERRTPEGWIPSGHSAMVSEVTFSKAQVAIENRRRHGPEGQLRHLLSGLLRCPACGAPMSGQLMRANGSRRKDYRYYTCSARQRGCHRLRAEATESATMRAVFALDLSPTKAQADGPHRPRRTSFKRRMERLVAAVEEGTLPADEVKRRLALLEHERTALSPSSHASSGEVPLDLPGLWAKAHFKERRQILEALIDHIRVEGDGGLSIVWR